MIVLAVNRSYICGDAQFQCRFKIIPKFSYYVQYVCKFELIIKNGLRYLAVEYLTLESRQSWMYHQCS